jgi:4a-hydroxytetrahydrobiopterin dehydratase
VRRLLDAEEVARQVADLPGWTGTTESLRRSYEFADFPTLVRAVDEIAVDAEEMDHHPDLDIRWRTLHVTCSTHDRDGVTKLDVELAHRVHDVAERLGAA